MSKKETCKKLMLELFGPNTASKVDTMPEDDCVNLCRSKTMAFLGEDKASFSIQ